MNSSYESEFNKKNFGMKDMITEIDTKSINTNLSNLNFGNFSSTKLFFKNSSEQKKLGSTFSLQNEILKDTSSLGLIKIRKTEKEKLNNKIINLDNKKYEDSWIDICSDSISKIVLTKVVDQCYFEGHLHLKNNLDTEYILVKFIRQENETNFGKRRKLEDLILKFYFKNTKMQNRLGNVIKEEI